MITKNTKDLLEKDEKYVWHGFKPNNQKPTILSQAKGSVLTDLEGNEYLDGSAGLMCVNIGYGREELAKAAYDELTSLSYAPLTNKGHAPAIKLAEKLNEWLEDDYIIYYSNSGSEANETAFKVARQYHEQNNNHGRYKFISRYRAYHGNSMGALAATGQAMRKYRYEPLSPGFIHVSPPDPYRTPYSGTMEEIGRAHADEIDRVIGWELEDTVAGIIMEPIITGGGILIPPDNYLKAVREICDRRGVLLIMDEVLCGFGRTGEKFGFMNYGIKPDIITMAKGITSSYLPLAVTAVKKDLFKAFQGIGSYDHLRHASTFGGNPASSALALKNIEIMENEQLVSRSKRLGERLLEEFDELKETPYVGDIRGKGLLFGIELVEDKVTKRPAQEKVSQVIDYCSKKRVIIGNNFETVEGFSNVIHIGPPLCITDDELSLLIHTVKEAINEL